MACGNNDITRDDVGQTITTEPDRAALARQIRQIASTSTAWRPLSPGPREHAASQYNSRTGKIDVYTDAEGMPRLGNVYPHVHEFSSPNGDDGVTASVRAGKGEGNHVGGSTLPPGTSGRDLARVAAVAAARAVVAQADSSHVGLDECIAELGAIVNGRSNR